MCLFSAGSALSCSDGRQAPMIRDAHAKQQGQDLKDGSCLDKHLASGSVRKASCEDVVSQGHRAVVPLDPRKVQLVCKNIQTLHSSEGVVMRPATRMEPPARR